MTLTKEKKIILSSLIDFFPPIAINVKEKTGIKKKEPENVKTLYVLSINSVYILWLCL